MFYQLIDTKIGTLTIISDGEALIGLYFGESAPINGVNESDGILEHTQKQLEEYFTGKRMVFDLPLKPQGTAFQERVWNALMTIPYGETRAYSEIAVQVDSPKGFRAVGLANNQNPISIIIPCHRVIGKNRKLVGYGGGLETKEFLLSFEKENC